MLNEGRSEEAAVEEEGTADDEVWSALPVELNVSTETTEQVEILSSLSPANTVAGELDDWRRPAKHRSFKVTRGQIQNIS